MAKAPPLTLDELRGAPHLAPTPERQPWLESLADQLLSGGRGRGRKPADQDWLTARQLLTRRRREVPLGENLHFLSRQLQFR